jgi:hypothetical protein
MEDPQLELANLQVKISMLHRTEVHYLTLLADGSQSASVHDNARLELRRVMLEMLAAAAAIRVLESKQSDLL